MKIGDTVTLDLGGHDPGPYKLEEITKMKNGREFATITMGCLRLGCYIEFLTSVKKIKK